MVTAEDIKMLLAAHHTGLVILMPGTQTDCPGEHKVLSRQPIIVGADGCKKCMLYTLRHALENNPDFKRVVTDALNLNFNP